MTNFFDRVYKVVKKIPKGKVMTYGQISKIINNEELIINNFKEITPRMVGWALHANKDGELVPCHRVVNRDGRLAPGYVFGGPSEQRARLLAEGVEFIDDNHVKLN